MTAILSIGLERVILRCANVHVHVAGFHADEGSVHFSAVFYQRSARIFEESLNSAGQVDPQCRLIRLISNYV